MKQPIFLSRQFACLNCDKPIDEKTGFTIEVDGEVKGFLCKECGEKIALENNQTEQGGETS